jgi:hypothetical protein
VDELAHREIRTKAMTFADTIAPARPREELEPPREGPTCRLNEAVSLALDSPFVAVPDEIDAIIVASVGQSFAERPRADEDLLRELSDRVSTPGTPPVFLITVSFGDEAGDEVLKSMASTAFGEFHDTRYPCDSCESAAIAAEEIAKGL